MLCLSSTQNRILPEKFAILLCQGDVSIDEMLKMKNRCTLIFQQIMRTYIQSDSAIQYSLRNNKYTRIHLL